MAQQWTPPPEGSPCWIEVPARDLEKLKSFYAALFPSWEWKGITGSAEDDHAVYRYTYKRPDGLSGGLVKMPKATPPHSQSMGAGFTVYYFVNSIEETIPRIESLGGTLVLPKTAEGENGFYANLTDPEGNRFGIYEWAGPTGSS